VSELGEAAEERVESAQVLPDHHSPRAGLGGGLVRVVTGESEEALRAGLSVFLSLLEQAYSFPRVTFAAPPARSMSSDPMSAEAFDTFRAANPAAAADIGSLLIEKAGGAAKVTLGKL
jgi:hypothetical protein